MNQHIIAENDTILSALGMLNALSGKVMTLFAVSTDGVMSGTVTDGDIRRGFLAGAQPSWPVSRIMNRNFTWLMAGDTDLEALRSYRMKGVRLIPVIDRDGHITDIVDTTVTPTRLPVSAILMAGGKGERLRPLTLDTPKPLLPIGGKAIIDYNIEALAACGVTDIHVTVNYLAHKLEEHFATPVGGVSVKCVREDRPLGTIGSARLVPLPEHGHTVIMNSDLLTTVSFEDMYLAHMREQAAITIGAIPYNVSVPYAILATDGQRVTALEEKPSYSYYANAGIYIMDNSLLRSLPDCRTDATDLIEQAIDRGLKVTYYPISGTWIDIGSPADYRHATELMRHRALYGR
ncbi:MAG: sugar phosphate nucleotidyltransferase [Muribaculaceae bacterium]|nr:sugar phosphate nucleotidyltransferase [Muribaculaceae bacterium]